MLARVAENMYWMARYLERAEDLARLIDVTTHLHLDLPRGSTPSWGTLLTLIGAEESYREKHGVAEDEGRVLRFLWGIRTTLSRFGRPLPLLGQMPGVFGKFSPEKPGKTSMASTTLAWSNCKVA